MTYPPQWAQELMLRALLWWEQESGQPAPAPSLQWRWIPRSARRFHATGSCAAIKVTMGTHVPRWRQKSVLLHEIAHAVGDGTHEEHSHCPAFWVRAWRFFRWARLPLRAVLLGERAYRRGALAGYRDTRPAAASRSRQRG